MLITKFVEVTITPYNVKHYEELGYDVKMNQIINIPINHLTKGSEIKVEVECDYCHEIILKKYKDFFKNKQIVNKDSCKKCRKHKTKETNLIKYGVESVFQIKEVKEDIKNTMINKYGTHIPLLIPQFIEKKENTCLEKYGVRYPAQTIEVIKKMQDTCLDRYGVKIYAKTEEFKENLLNFWNNISDVEIQNIVDKRINTLIDKYGVENASSIPSVKKKMAEYWNNVTDDEIEIMTIKRRETCQERYGYDSVSQVPEIRQKMMETCMDRYGYENAMQNPEIKEKAHKTLLKNGEIPTSQQQLTVYEILKVLFGESNTFLNYPYKNYCLDTSLFINKLKIDIEYDGWYWHNKEKDTIRNNYLIENNWKILRIKSGNKLPTIEQLKDKLNVLINTYETYQEIILEDWKDREVAM